MLPYALNMAPPNADEEAEFLKTQAAALNEQLKELFFEREKAGEEYRSHKHADTQRGNIFESKLNLFSWPDEPVKVLAGHCHDSLVKLVAGLNQYDDKQLEQFRFEYHSWFHITRTGGYQGLHDHLAAPPLPPAAATR